MVYVNKRSGVTFGCCFRRYHGSARQVCLFAGVSTPVQAECRAGLCIAVSINARGPDTVSNELPAQAELPGAVTEVRAPGAEVIVRDGAAARLVFQGYRIISWSDGHQQEHGASAQRLLHLFRHHPQGTIEPDVAINTVYRAGMGTLSLCGSSGKTAFT